MSPQVCSVYSLSFIFFFQKNLKERPPTSTQRCYHILIFFWKVFLYSQHNMEDEALIKPRKGRGEPAVGPHAIMALTRSDLLHLSQFDPFRGGSPRDMTLFSLYLAHRGPTPPMAMAGPFCGAPLAVIGLEKLIAFGATDVWVLGWCGSIQPTLKVGDLVIPLRAVSEEGTSKHYPISMGEAGAHPKLLNLLQKKLEEKGFPFTQGPVWTTDAPYRETAQKVRHYQEAGVLAVEMELSALFTVAAYRGVRLIALLVVSDELFDLKWVPGFSTNHFRERACRAGEMLLNLIDTTTSQPDRGRPSNAERSKMLAKKG